MLENVKIIEHEKKILTSHGWLTERQLADMNARKREQQAQAAPPPAPEPPTQSCPFSTATNPVCKKGECAWFGGGRCAVTCVHPGGGKRCPIKNGTCSFDCALRGNN